MQHLILAGGGHAHLFGLSLKQLPSLPKLQITLISPSRHQYYSGMYSGFAEGIYSDEEIRVDLKKTAERAGITFLQTEVFSADSVKKQVFCRDGSVLSYDLLSFDIGSSEQEKEALPIKPNFHFTDSIMDFRESEAPVIAGSGAAGLELALSVQAWRKKNSRKTPVVLVGPEPYISEKFNGKLKSISRRKGIRLLSEKAEQIQPHSLITSSGKEIPFSSLLFLGGPSAHPVLAKSFLMTDRNGFLLVDSFLESVQRQGVFGAGDCVTLTEYPSLPKNGLYAIRQGEILWENFRRYADGRTLKPFSPQKRYLSILSIGDREGFLMRGSIGLKGSFAWKLKRKIDQDYMGSF
ncbi:FAD-dependent oxidoreductase [Metabacillus sp. GX 13764]|uniref:FAD-dependent oxidoreductase n=1 Tax=Metabacillus kandeliae TaxID=2900151 RepID=UPI001E2B8C63|nr:FAD-dependent oxidoreductase [Metabacillus kandeliae]MCD7036074.1 FAD-dependent oxidoreductase [Metabacillus kandeliae]